MERMLVEVKNAPNKRAKRTVIKQFNPHHYIFGVRLDPRNPYDTDNTTERNEDVSK